MGMEIISAREAFNRGLSRYFTGKECSYGHLDERMISNGSCVTCLNEKRKRTRQDKYEATKVWRLKNPNARTIEARKYREKHPEKVAQRSKNWREKNIVERRIIERENARKMRATNPDAQKIRTAKHKAKKDLEKEILAGRRRPEICEICSKNEFRIVFDHCHNSGKFRGWICDRCNRTLGIVKDNPNLLREMAIYLEKSNG